MRHRGTSLIEVLVVMVVFLVGILAIVQIFPGGFRILTTSRNNTLASVAGSAQMEVLKAHADQLPDLIAFVRYNLAANQIEAEPNRFPGDLGPAYTDFRQDGVFYDSSGNVVGSWPYLTGANVARRILGEGKAIPTPRPVGTYYGGLMSLQFAPIVYNPSGTYRSLFVVYGNDMAKRSGDPVAAGINRIQNWEFFVDQEDTSSAVLFLPPLRFKTAQYRINLTIYVNNGGGVIRRDLVDLVTNPIPADPALAPYALQVSNIPGVLQAGENLVGIDYDSVTVARLFDNVANSSPFSEDPYEYKLISPQLGVLLFNPAGFNYIVRQAGGQRVPLEGRVSYDVYDWRILREEFRVPDSLPAQYKLAFQSLKVSTEPGPDGTISGGMGFSVPDINGNPQSIDLVLQDTETGGVYVFNNTKQGDPTASSYSVNKSSGLVTLNDYDGNAANGLQLMLMYPGITTPTVVDAENRSIRALYMAKGEWAVQVLKPASRYTRSSNFPGLAQYQVNSNGRVYFPPCDTGRMISLGEIYYISTGGQQMGPVELTAAGTNTPADPNGPYIDVAANFPDFNGWDESYGSAVKSVNGASVAVRVLWNPDFFRLTDDPPTNLSNFNKWMQGWRRQTVETTLQRKQD